MESSSQGHAYTPLVVYRALIHATERTANKAYDRLDNGVKVKDKGITSGVHHFDVQSSSGKGMRHVEYDTIAKTFRCSCEWGYYGKYPTWTCHHVLIVNDVIPWDISEEDVNKALIATGQIPT